MNLRRRLERLERVYDPATGRCDLQQEHERTLEARAALWAALTSATVAEVPEVPLDAQDPRGRLLARLDTQAANEEVRTCD